MRLIEAAIGAKMIHFHFLSSSFKAKQALTGLLSPQAYNKYSLNPWSLKLSLFQALLSFPKLSSKPYPELFSKLTLKLCQALLSSIRLFFALLTPEDNIPQRSMNTRHLTPWARVWARNGTQVLGILILITNHSIKLDLRYHNVKPKGRPRW